MKDMFYCPYCKASAFVKAQFGACVTLDCGHAVTTRKKPSSDMTTTPVTQVPARGPDMKPQRKPRHDDAPPVQRVGSTRIEPPAAPSTFDVSAVTQRIKNLLKKR